MRQSNHLGKTPRQDPKEAQTVAHMLAKIIRLKQRARSSPFRRFL
jgi:hypothetical protein